MDKMIDGVTKGILDMIMKFAALLGVYAAYELTFNMGIPFFALAIVVLVVLTLAWHFTAEEPKEKAIPVTVVKDAEPVIPGLGGGG